MANPNININVGGNTTKLRQQINQVARQPISVNVQAAGGAAQPLGRISGQIQEIDKSLAAANARVIAFAASAGAIYAIKNAVTSLFNTFVNVEKKLADVNVLLNLTDKNLAKFGASLFDIAGNTAQSFDTVAEAATELSRQGLGVEETLKRTEAALILTRLSGLDAAASVSALTSAINSFGSSALDATEIVNKLASVDSSFAVSSADLANALSRVGSSASDAGVSFDELIALVTTAQQVTARGGSVIGNSLKTIFTRLGRGKVQDVLSGIGVSATDEQGNQKSQIQLLKELAGVYDDLSATQKNYVAEQVGGVFQINVLKAALNDLGKEYSIYDQALKTSLGTTDEATRRNQKLNETLSARGAKALADIQQAGAGIAGGLFGPAASNVLNISEFLTGAINDSDAQSIGAKIGGGIITGIGNFIGGPGLALVTAAAIKLFAEFSKYGAEAFKSLLGVNQASKEQAAVQQSVVKFLQNNASIYKLIASGQTSVADGARSYLQVIKQQTVELQKQNSIAAQIAKTTASQIGVQTVAGKSFITQRGAKIKTAAGGYLPSEYDEAINISNRVGGANPATDRPVTIKNFSFGGGKKGAVTAHTGEWAIPNYGGTDGTAIWNKQMKQKYGLPDGARKISASGYIPNFATEKKSFPGGVISGRQSSLVANQNLDTYSPFSFDLISIGNKSSFENQFNKQLQNLTSKDSAAAMAATKYFAKNGYSLSQIGQLKQNLLTGRGKKVPSLLSSNSAFVNKSLQVSGVKNNVLGKYFERFAANRLGLQIAQKQNARMDLVDKAGNPAAEVKFGKLNKDNLISKVIDTTYGKKFKQNPPIKDNIIMPNNYKLVVPNAAYGFIPNFAQTKEVIDLGDTRTSTLLNNKVLSLIYPQISEGYSMIPAVGSYLGKTYKGLIPVAGINKNVIKGELPDLQKNLGDLLVREANQFGQAVGGKNFLNSAKELPNYGAAEGAVGVAFEGGLLTLLQKDLQKTSQNAGIDFRQNRITPKLRNLFHGAPGMYDAKSSPGAANEVMQKLLNEAKPGAVKQVRSGSQYKDVQALRGKALESIRKEGLVLRRGPQLEKEIEKRMAAMRGLMSGGYIPTLAAPDLIKQINSRIINPNIAAKLSEGAGLSNNAYIKAASKLGVNTSGLEAFLKQPGFPLRGKKKIAGLSRALGKSFGRSFNIDALKLGDWNYVKKDFEANGLTKSDFDKVAEFAKSKRGENAFRWGFKSKASGFIPNLAISDQYTKSVLALEESISGKKAIIDNKPFLHIRNKSQPSYASAISDHGGKNKAMKDSADMQRDAGLLAASGFVPNFAAGDNGENYNSGTIDFAAVSGAISSLLFSLAFFGGQLDDGAKQLRQLKGELKSTGQTLDQAFQSNQKRINKQNRALETINAREQAIRSNSSWYNKQTGMYTQEGQARITRVERDRATVERALARSEQRQESIITARERSREGVKAKFGRFAQQKGLAFGFAGQALGGVGAQLFGGENTTGGAISTAVGNIAGFAGTGAMIGKGPWGAAIGGLVGAAVSAKPVLDALTTSVNELSKAAAEARESAQRAAENSQQISTSRQTYEDLLKNPNVDIKKVTKAEGEYLSALGKLPKAYLEQYTSARDLTEAQEVLAKYMKEQASGADMSELILDLEKGLNTWFSSLSKGQAKSLGQRTLSVFDIGTGQTNVEKRIAVFKDFEKVISDGIKTIEGEIKLRSSGADNPGAPLFNAIREFFTGTKKEVLTNVFNKARSQIDTSTDEGKSRLNRVNEIEKVILQQNPSLESIRAYLTEIESLVKGERKSYESILENQRKREAIIRNMPPEQRALLDSIQENRKKLEDQADVFGNLNKIKNISIPKFNLDLARQTDTAVMQYRDPSFEQERALSQARLNQESALKRIEIGADVLESFRSDVQKQLSDVLDQALSKQGSAELATIAPDLQALNEKLRTSTSFEQIKNLDVSALLDKAGPNLKQAWQDSMDGANKKFKMAMDQLRFETETAKVKEAFDIASKRYSERIQKMQGYAGGISGLVGFDITQMEGDQLTKGFKSGQIGPKKYKREMAKFQREQTVRQLEAVDALGIPEQYKAPIRNKLINQLQSQSDKYLDAVGLSDFKGVGRSNVIDMVKQQYGGMRPDEKFSNPFNQAAEDLVKSIGAVGIDIQKYSQQALGGLQTQADNAAEKLLNLASSAQQLISVISPSTPAASTTNPNSKTTPPITITLGNNGANSPLNNSSFDIKPTQGNANATGNIVGDRQAMPGTSQFSIPPLNLPGFQQERNQGTAPEQQQILPQTPKPPSEQPNLPQDAMQNMQGLIASLNANADAVKSNTSAVIENTTNRGTKEDNNSQQKQDGENKTTSSSQEIKIPVDLKTDFKIDLSASEEVISAVNEKFIKVEDQLRTELTSAIDELRRQLTVLQTNNAQK